jgi:hypothetical protein
MDPKSGRCPVAYDWKLMRHTIRTTLTLIASALTIASCSASPSTGREYSARRMAPPISSTTTTTTIVPPTTTTLPATTTTQAVRPPVVQSTPTTQCPAEIVALVHKHFDQFGTNVAEWMIGIVWRESRCVPTAASPTQCFGLTQTALPLHADLYTALGLDWRTSWMDPDANLAAAALLYASSGSSPWRL